MWVLHYPMKNISCLGIDEPEAFNSNNWQNPVLTEFGIKIFKRIPNKKYKENYENYLTTNQKYN